MNTEIIQKIKQTLRATRERRKTQIPKVFQFKLQNLSEKDKKELDRLFLEAKWFYNYIIADIQNRLNDSIWKVREVEIKTPAGTEVREIRQLSSQMRYGLVGRIKNNLHGLKKAKEKGLKVGKLSFKTEVKSILLPQYGNTYRIDKNRVKIQKLKKKFRVLGLHQIPKNAEITEAQLLKKPSGYYIHVCCFLPKQEVMEEIRQKQTGDPVGIDLGIKHQVTLSTGEKFKWYISETDRVKKLQRVLGKKQKGSKNYLKVKLLLRKEWEYIINKRKDTLNKITSYLKKSPFIAVQNDSVKSWHEGWFGKQVQNTGIGGITARLKNLATLMPVIFVDTYEPTTQTCSFCGYRHRISLSERIFECPNCGKEIDRDVNAARNILRIALEKENSSQKTLPVDCGEVTLVERPTGVSLKQEAPI